MQKPVVGFIGGVTAPGVANYLMPVNRLPAGLDVECRHERPRPG